MNTDTDAKNIESFIKSRWNNYLSQHKEKNEADHFIYYDLDFFLIILLLELYQEGTDSISLHHFTWYWLEKMAHKSPYVWDYDYYKGWIFN